MKTPRIVYPHRCFVCGELQTAPCTLCPDCEPLRLHPDGEGARCPVCGLRKKRCVCGNKLYYETLTFPFYYEGRVRKALHRMKYHEGTSLFAPFAREMTDALRRRELLLCPDAVCYAPMHPRDKRKRGYDQARELAECVGAILEVPTLPLLKKTEKTERQHELSLLLRQGNLLGAFEPETKYLPQIENKRILLVDDIHTTGNTLNEAAKTLMIFGAARVDCICAAATPRNDHS